MRRVSDDIKELKSIKPLSKQRITSQDSQPHSEQVIEGQLLRAEVIIRKSFKDFFRNVHRRIKEIGSVTFAFNTKGIEVLCGSLSNTFWYKTCLKYVGSPQLDNQDVAITSPIAFEMDPLQFCKDMENISENCYVYFNYFLDSDKLSLHIYCADQNRFCIFTQEVYEETDEVAAPVNQSKNSKPRSNMGDPMNIREIKDEETDPNAQDDQNISEFVSHINIGALDQVDDDELLTQHNICEYVKIQLKQISNKYMTVDPQVPNLGAHPDFNPISHLTNQSLQSRQTDLLNARQGDSMRPEAANKINANDILKSASQSMIEITFLKLDSLVIVLESIVKMSTPLIRVAFAEDILFETVSCEYFLCLHQNFTLFEQDKIKIVKRNIRGKELRYSLDTFTMILSICKTIPGKINPKLQISFLKDGMLSFCTDSGPDHPAFELFFAPKYN